MCVCLPRRPLRTNLRVREMNDEANFGRSVDGRAKWLMIEFALLSETAGSEHVHVNGLH